MQPVVRSTLVGLLTIAGLAACGDKVTVPPPTTPVQGTVVHGVTVTPPSATMAIGDKLIFAASVDADQGVTDRTVTWSTSNSAVATVGTDGTVTAVAGGTASIVAKSHADPTVSGAAVVTVQAVVPASVTIGQINQTVCAPGGGSCSSVPAVLTNVAGQLDVTLNVDAGTQKVSSVQLLMNCGGADTVVGTQTLSAASQATAEASAAPVTISFNTAGFNAATGAVAFKNGNCQLKAKAITSTGTQSAVSSTTITLNNVNFLSVAPLSTTAGTGQVASATDGSGLTWRAGSVVVTAVPIIYSNVTVATASVSLINLGNDHALGKNAADVAAAGTVGTLSGLTPASGVITATFPLSTTATGGVGGAVVDSLGATVSTVDSQGNPGPTLAASLSNFIRLDNKAPNIGTVTPPVFVANTQNTANGWTGANFVFSIAAGSLKADSAVTDNLAEIIVLNGNTNKSAGGVDKVTIATQWAPQGTGASSTAWATFTSVSSLAETAAATGTVAYDLRLVICDALGNCSTTPTLTTFGVDKTAPTEVKGSVPKDMEVVGIGATLSSATLQVAGTDPQGANGVTGSGFGSNPVLVQETRLTSASPAPTNGQTNLCVIGTAASPAGSGCKTPFASNAFASTQTVNLTTTNPGQYSLVFQVTDQAGNMSAPDSIRYYIDNANAPSMSGGISIPASITNGSVFTASGVDDMDFASVNAVLHYPGLANSRLMIPGTSSAAGVTFDNTLTRTSTATVTLSNFIRQLGTMDAAGAVAGETKPDQISIRGVDAANNLSTGDLATFPGNNIANGVSLAGTTLGFTITSDQATLSNGTNNTGTPPKSATLTATVNALNANAGTPFAQVCFYISNPSGAEGAQADPVSKGGATELFLLGCTATTTTILNGTQKQILSTMVFDPNALYGTAGTLQLWAVGITSAGDAVITAASAPIALAN